MYQIYKKTNKYNSQTQNSVIPLLNLEKNEEILHLDDYEGMAELLPLYDDSIITHTECADEETIVSEDSEEV